MINASKWVFILLLLSGTAFAVEDDVVRRADTLLNGGKAAEAYTLLVPYQSDRAGDPDFDYRLGMAALDSGHPNEAIFALERVLAVKPDHLQARAEIARAYLAVGETATSRQEFETVKKQAPPKEVNATIQKFLDAIEKATAGERTTLGGYLEAAVGTDSNANSATGNSQIAIPAFGGSLATLSDSGVKQKDNFASIAGGFNVRHPFSPKWAMFGGLNFNQRNNSSHGIFDTRGLDGNLGVSLTRGGDSYSAALQAGSFEVDNNRYRDATGLTAQWIRTLGNSGQFTAYLQYSQLRYPDQKTRDADRSVLGAAYAMLLGGSYAPVVYIGAYAGQEAEKASNVPYLGHKPYGLRTGGEMSISPKMRLFGSANLESRKYGGEDPFFLVSRNDTQADLKAGVSYVPARNWALTPQLNYIRNKSNIVINDYDRTMFSVSLRRDFN